MEYFTEHPWHEGEDEMHNLLHVPNRENPTSPYLTPFASHMLQHSPLLALGALDAEGRPWTSIWGGEVGFARAIAQSVIGVKSIVDMGFDPVLQSLMGKDGMDGEIVRPDGVGLMVGGLAIDLESRGRVKLYGRMMVGAVAATDDGVGEMQLVVRIEQSLGNCPKYLNKKHIVPAVPRPSLLSDKLPLSSEALALIAKSDLFFISSSHHNSDMDTNHRGGPPGFVRVVSNDDDSCVIVYPEYSGNRLYQTLGNLRTTPLAGLVFPDFDTGDVLYVTGRTEVLVGKEANSLLPRINLAVKITLSAARFVKSGLSFKGIPGDLSPYNPPVRLLEKEQKNVLPGSVDKSTTAKLISKEIITPSIARYRFQSEGKESATTWKPGQYVALSFEDELGMGYSHMRDDDPTSLNDDLLRTFTVSSPAPPNPSQFEVTVRSVGRVTKYLFRLNSRAHLEVPLVGFGGEFFLKQAKDEVVGFVAGGVGITPLLAQGPSLDLARLNLYWTVRKDDLGLVVDTLTRIPGLASSTQLFITGKGKANASKIAEIEKLGAHFQMRRLQEEDFKAAPQKVYLCTSVLLRNKLLEWLAGKTVLFEDFGY